MLRLAIFLTLTGAIFVALVLAVPALTVKTGNDAMAEMQVYEPEPTSSILTLSADELRVIIQDQQQHDERMADKIVKVAVSGDVAQSATSVSMSVVYIVGFVAFVLVLLLLILPKRQGGA